MDWLDSFREDPSERFISGTLADSCDTPDSDPEGVIAAAEVVAVLCGKPPAIPHDELVELPQIPIQASVRVDAAHALDRVLNGSWLRLSWAETDLLDPWIAEIADLRERLIQQ